MESSDLLGLYEQLQTCLTEVGNVNRELDLLEERKNELPIEKYLEEFDRIAKEAERLNKEKQIIGKKIEELAQVYE